MAPADKPRTKKKHKDPMQLETWRHAALVAVLAALWHGVRFVVVHARAHAAGHVPRFSLTRRLHWHELTDDGRHHLKRAFQSFFIFFGLTALGFVCVVAWAFWRHG